MDKGLWEKFTATGRVEDYLMFAASKQSAASRRDGKEHAGISGSDGDRAEAIPGQGVRQSDHAADQRTGQDIGFC